MEPEQPSAVDEERDAPRHARTDPPPRSVIALRYLTIVGALIVVIVVAVNLTSTEEPGRSSPAPTPPERGAACPDLKEAYDRRVAGDAAGFLESARSARRIAEQTLQRGQIVFGAPERIAVELSVLAREEAAGGRAGKIDGLLGVAEERCTELGRW